jgi:hypothetical protein
MKKIILFAILIPLMCNAQTPLWQGKGRIVIGCDGNEHDNDDWAATPLSLALLASQGLQDKLAVYMYSDHVWGSNRERAFVNGLNAYEQMVQSALGGQKWFGFKKTHFICAVDDPKMAYDAIRNEINKSSAGNPLFIIEAGPMQMVGEAISKAEKSKLKYVTLISHSEWNNEHANKPYDWEHHSGWDTLWTFRQIMEQFSAPEKGGLTCVKILDQNGGSDYLGIRTNKSEFDWLKTSALKDKAPYYQRGSWDWLSSRLYSYIDCRGGELFDASDAGMVVYVLTGVEKTNPDMVRRLMEKN